MERNLRTIVSLFAVLLLCSCSDLFEFSPYQAFTDISNFDKNQNERNIAAIEAKSSAEFREFTVALFGDTHTYYDDFEDFVKVINKMENVDFAIHLGDITLSGINREFMWYSDIVNGIKIPVVTIIGNHDYLSNGEYLFREMFGETNLTFVYNNCKFVIFDDVIWEHKVEDPDFIWFAKSIQNDSSYQHVIPLSHIPPWDSQFSFGNELAYNYFLSASNIPLSIHGHVHRFDTLRPYPNMGNVLYLTTPDMKDRAGVLLTVKAEGCKIEQFLF